uniref:Uncharacterized protein LOC105140217 n=1 Tax=Rhizophora mucronata TaxID=61149 RepID=A0A2P2JX07_RHIMU
MFSELLMKMGELSGSPASLRCKLPTEDLDALVSITSEEDLANLIEEYDRAAATPMGSLKIRAFLWPPKKMSPFSHHPSPSSASSSFKLLSSSSSSSSSSSNGHAATSAPTLSCYRQFSKPVAYPVKRTPSYGYHVHGNPTTYVYRVHNGHYWQ